MSAITVTQQRKDDNPVLFRGVEVDSIRERSIPNTYKNIDGVLIGYKNATSVHVRDGWKPVIRPVINPAVERYGDLIENAEDFTAEVVALSDEEIQERTLNQAEGNRVTKLNTQSLANVEEDFQDIDDDEEALKNQDAYPFWRDQELGFNFEVGKKYQDFNNDNVLKLYQVIQPHNKQVDFVPKDTPALFRVVEVAGETEWQPNVLYNIGDVRSYQAVDYRCIQSHTSQIGFEPPNVPALWVLNN
jgi:hypothetical protein